MAFAPIAIPGLVIGVAMIWFYLTVPFPVKIYGTMAILVIAYVTLFIPYGVRLSYAGFTQVHPELEDAAATSGSSWLRTLRTVSVPLLAPSIFVGACFVFLRTFRELSAALLLAPFGSEPYSVVAFEMWLNGDTNKTAAYGVVAVGVMLAVVVILGLVLRRVRGASQLLRF
jgi:iron(III) transport system permease protein